MCGITGFVSLKRYNREQLNTIASSMGDQIRHRGPDAHDIWLDEESGIALSHQRLSIVDLSPAGTQPMVSANNEWVIVYNGEIYNADELRKELQPQRMQWRGTSDTEVILEAIAEWGVKKTINKLIGMFAFAVWHKSSRTMTLVRDRLGIKPLYWAKTSNSLIFGSELKALLKHPDFPTDLNRGAIAGFLRNCYINNPNTIYKGVHQLQPGWLMHWSEAHHEPVHEQYWSLSEVAQTGKANQLSCSDSEATTQLENLLSDAVERRMVADVPLGAFLSGGIDSSLVVALMQKASSRPVKTFSIGFEDPKYDESEHAAAVANHLGTDHTPLTITAQDALNVVPQLHTMYDEPFSDPSQIPTYLVSKLTREHVTVALSGDGGDELFAGYRRYFDANKYTFMINQPKFMRNMQASILERLSPEMISKFGKFLPEFIESKLSGAKLQRVSPILRDGSMLSLYRRFLSRVESPSDILINCNEPDYPKWQAAESIDFGKDKYSLMQYLDTIDYLPDDILTKVDRASMAVSLEARVPILDHRVVEFAWSLPQHMKVRNNQGKWILRNLLYQHVPQQLVDRPKKGFGVPVGQWLRGPLREWAEDLLSNDSLKKTQIFHIEPVRKKWSQHLNEEVNWELHLWDVLTLQQWAINNSYSN